jgi:hypothetical protein
MVERVLAVANWLNGRHQVSAQDIENRHLLARTGATLARSLHVAAHLRRIGSSSVAKYTDALEMANGLRRPGRRLIARSDRDSQPRLKPSSQRRVVEMIVEWHGQALKLQHLQCREPAESVRGGLAPKRLA